MTHGGCGLETAQEIPLQLSKPPAGLEPQKVHFGLDPNNMGLQVACVSVRSTPSREALSKVYAERRGRALFPLAVAASDGTTTWVFGPNPDAQVLALPAPQANRFLASALGEQSAFTAVQRFAQLRESLGTSRNLGVTNAGLFANHHLRENVPQRADWDSSTERARPWLSKRGRDLIHALGFTDSRAAHDVLLLKPTDSSASRAVAILLNDEEHFEARSDRFNLTPIAYGLKVAAQQEVPWLIVLRQGQIRLYPAKDGVGVGQRSQADTFFELDLTMLAEDQAALLALVFSADALKPDGSTADILRGSSRYAIALGERLRDRIYEQVVPRLSTAVAEQLPVLGMPVDSEHLVLAYRLTLRILFRLLFQAYAEDRGLLPFDRNERYTANALKTLVERDLLNQQESVFDGNSTALWDDLQQVWRVIDKGDSAWNVPAYNGGLFGADPERHREGALLAKMALDNSVMGPVLRALLIDRSEEAVEGAVDFRSLSVREFGTVYEGLLESSLSLAEEDLTVDSSGAWVPAKKGDQIDAVAGTAYFHNSSGERKATGSYFTPTMLVEHLLDRALEPALKQHLSKVAENLDAGKAASAAELFFDFRVADLAMGSAHFLVAAVDRIETAFRNFLVDHQIPAVKAELQRLAEVARAALGEDAQFAGDIDEAMLLRRQIARRCIYGLDINEMAVELARLAIWIHTFVPGLPMSNLDHGLVCANSLTGIGTVEEALKVLDPQAHNQLSVFSAAIEESLAGAKNLLLDAASASEATKQEIAEAVELLKKAKAAAEPTRLIFDAAVAARLGVLTPGSFMDADSVIEQAQRSDVRDFIESLRPAHMPYLFPEVFLRDNGGFDVLIGNPPWEKVHVEEHQWWGLRIPGLRGMPAAARSKALKKFREGRADLETQYQADIRNANRLRETLLAGPYPGLGTAHVDLYQVFSWRNWHLIRPSGYFGLVLPRGALTGSGMSVWRREVLANGSFADVTFASNQNGWMFANVHGQYSIGLTVVTRHGTGVAAFCGPYYNADALKMAGQDLTAVPMDEFLSWSSTAAFPLLPDPSAAEIFRAMAAHPKFAQADPDWEFRGVQELNASSDKALFTFTEKPEFGMVPVFAGASFNLWDAGFGSPYAWAKPRALRQHLLTKLESSSRHSRSAYFGLTGFSHSRLPMDYARVAFRDVTNGTNTRTTIACLLPPGSVAVHNAPLLVRRTGDASAESFLLGLLCSIPFDWYARRWVELHLTFELLNTFPVPRPAPEHPWRVRMTEVAGRLAAVDERYEDWAGEVGVPVGSVKTPEEKADLVGENDALAFLLYGLSEDQVMHVFRTFHKGAYDAAHLATVQRHYEHWKSKA